MSSRTRPGTALEDGARGASQLYARAAARARDLLARGRARRAAGWRPLGFRSGADAGPMAVYKYNVLVMWDLN